MDQIKVKEYLETKGFQGTTLPLEGIYGGEHAYLNFRFYDTFFEFDINESITSREIKYSECTTTRIDAEIHKANRFVKNVEKAYKDFIEN